MTHTHQIVSRVAALGNVSVVQPFDAFCDAQTCRIVKDGRSLYRNTDHLTMDGVQVVAPALTSAILTSWRTIPEH